MPSAATTPPPHKIIHIDMDCFFAAIEMREHPELQHVPLAIGGRPEERGVLSTCNYEARRSGLHSAMPSSQALRLCPPLVLLPVNMKLYKEESARISEIFHRYTDLIEPLSLDEAYLDVTGSSLHQGSASLLAQEIRSTIFRERHLTASAGIAENKFLAKVASDWKKPDGQFTIPPENSSTFAAALPLEKIPGVGKISTQRFHEQNIHHCRDLLPLSLEEMVSRYGRFGNHLYEFIRGRDNRPVRTERIRKSLSTEDTFHRDISGQEVCLNALEPIYHEFRKRLAQLRKSTEIPENPCHCFVKIKYGDFQQTTIERRFPDMRWERFASLLKERYEAPRPVRLLGLGIRFPDAETTSQLSLSLREAFLSPDPPRIER